MGRPKTSYIERVRRISTMLFFFLIAAFVLFEMTRSGTFGSKVTGEGDLWNYVSSLVYLLAGEMAIVNAVLAGRREKGETFSQWMMAWVPWAMIGAAFTFTAFDEMLEIHEKLRHAVVQFMPFLDHIYPGHGARFMLVAFLAGSLVFAVAFLRESLSGRTSKLYLILGFVLVGAAIAYDSTPWLRAKIWTVIEEISELCAGAVFAASFASSATSNWITHRLHDLNASPSGKEATHANT